jgi:hypothetical protein
MKNLISRAPHSVVKLIGAENYRTYCGLLTSPSSRFRPETALEYGAAWAADNDCFKKYNPASILRMLNAYRGIPGCIFVTAPDVVGNAAETLKLFHKWKGVYYGYGYPIALVAQNGLTVDTTPFDEIVALFIGGTDIWRKSENVRRLVAAAKQRGKLLHWGRVSSVKRIQYLKTLNVDSFDGTHYTRWPNDIPLHLPYQHTHTPFLFNDL